MYMVTLYPSGVRKRQGRRKEIGGRNVQLTLDPPPTHWPQGTMGARPPRAALSRPTWNLTVVLSGRRW